MADLTPPEGITIPQDVQLSQDIQALVLEFQNFLGLQKKKQPKQEPEVNNNKTNESLKKIADNTDPEKSPLGDKIKESLDNGFKEFTDVANKTFTNISPALLGPLRLVTEPLQDLTGFSVSDKLNEGFQAITNGLTKKRKAKLNPNKTDVAEAGDEGIGAIYLGEKLDKYFGKSKKNEDGSGLLSGLVGGGLGKMLGGLLTKGLGIGMIIASLALMIRDGIMGAMKAEEWGVGKGSAIVGAVLGGTGEGWKNAFANAGKWALMGAGIGLLAGGPIGALIGGLAGAVIGGLLGYFGGEKIAKFVQNAMQGLSKMWDSTKEFFANAWTKTKEFFVNIWNSEFFTKVRTFIGDLLSSIFDFLITPFKRVWEQIVILKDKLMEIWGGEGNFLQKLGKSVGEILMFFPKAVWAYIKGKAEAIKNWFIDLFIGGRETPEGKKNKKALLAQFWDILKMFWGAVGKFMINTIQGAIRLFGRGVDFIKDTVFPGIKDFFSGLFTSVIENIKDFGTVISEVVLPGIGDFFTNIFSNIRKLLFGENGEGGLINNVKDTISEFFDDPKEFISNVWTSLTEGISSFVDNFLNIFRFIQYKGIGESLKILFTEGMEGFFGQVTDFSANYDSLPEEDKENFLQKLGNGILGVFKKDTIDDAIITKDGQIIRTSPDDNLIATKSPVQTIPINPNRSMTLETPLQAVSNRSERLSYNNQNIESSDIVETLKRILNEIITGNSILDSKDMNPVIVNSGGSGSLAGLTQVGASE
jgi:hypothetical protein